MRTITLQRLLVAMRLGKRFDGAAFADGGSGLADFAPPVLQADFELGKDRRQDRRDTFILENLILPPEVFEAGADIARAAMADGAGWAGPTLDPAVLQKALAIAALEIGRIDSQSRRQSRWQMARGGLQISGVRISDPGNASDLTPLRLSNARLPFSLRLINCLVEAPIILNNCDLVTLDLSGSALAGLDATFLHAAGSVRLRRTYVQAPVDFGGARINGYFDATDIIIKPFGPVPACQAFDADRGMLNLSQATISNEVRLERATIWGGLAMRGLTTERSVFLNEASLLSPVAIIEAIALGIPPIDDAAIPTPVWGWQDDAVPDCQLIPPTRLKPKNFVTGRRAFAVAAADIGVDSYRDRFAATGSLPEECCLHLLLIESLRVRTSALRADGMVVGGTVFAEALTAHGRLRMKYADIRGALVLRGSLLRSVEAIRRSFDDLFWSGAKTVVPLLGALLEYRKNSYESSVSEAEFNADQLAYGADFFALDLRESLIAGSLRIGSAPNDPHGQREITRINGSIGAERLRVFGEVHLANVEFEWSHRIRDRHPETGEEWSPTDDGPRREAECLRHHQALVDAGRRHTINFSNAEVGDSVHLEACKGLAGIDLRNARIKGDLSFFASMELTQVHNGQACRVDRPALGITGRVCLVGADVAGDARLLFDRGLGPSIDAEYLRVAGELEISSTRGGISFGHSAIVMLDPAVFDREVRESDDAWRTAEVAAHGGPKTWQGWIEAQHRLPKIDLRNGRATVFGHPSPAWPYTGRLEITGFVYERSKGFGPLAPHPAKIGLDERSRRGWTTTVFFFGISLVLALLWNWQPAFSTASVPRWLVMADYGDTIFWLSLLFFAAAVDMLLPIFRPPLRAHSGPMAVPYLNLQRLEFNRYRSNLSMRSLAQRSVARLFMSRQGLPPLRGNVYHALEPYGIAAQALRAEGRWITGNLVEERRLHVRTGQLSWRLHFFAKAGYNMGYWSVRYGFSYVRLGYVTALLILVTAAIAEHGVRNGAIFPDDSRITFGATIDGRRIIQTSAVACPFDGAPIDGCVKFSPVAFGIEAVVPSVSLGEMDKWEFKPDGRWELIKVARGPKYKDIIFAVRLIGFALAGLLLIGITSRIGTFVGRYRD